MIKRCQLPVCGKWYIGEPKSRYCGDHGNSWLMDKNPRTGKRSKFSEDDIRELRAMFHEQPAELVAAYFGVTRSTIYRYVKDKPKNLRPEWTVRK